MRQRELVIDRVTARCGCEYEWGVHVVGFGTPLGLTEDQITATINGQSDDPAWSERDRLLVRLADELHRSATVSDDLWSELEARWPHDQLIELVVTAGWYRLISYVVNVAGVENEPWAARFPRGLLRPLR